MPDSRLQHLAQLAHLELTPGEEERYSKDIADVLSYVERVQHVPVSHQTLTSTITGIQHILRVDVSAPSELAEELLKRAPETERGMVKVPAVL